MIVKTVGELTAATSVAAGDKIPVEQSGVLKYATGKQLRASIIKEVSADYTVLDDDPDIIEVTTGDTDRTIYLPALANNIGREIIVRKVDSGTGKVIIQRKGTDTITRASLTSATLTSNGDWWKLQAGSTRWELVDGVESKFDSSQTAYRYSNGVQQIFGTYTLIYNAANNVRLTITFPFSFVDSNYVTGASLFAPSSGVLQEVVSAIRSANIDSTSTVLVLYRVNGTTDFVSGDFMVISCVTSGRWYA